MRNYDELLAAANATTTFPTYVGDGYSVPWQVALAVDLPFGVLLWAYKAYLDARFAPGAHLHDWCYTPYGGEISVTREEADNALGEYIARTSPADAAIVLAAVRAGGGPYFGNSQTGYGGNQAWRVTQNMGLAPGVC